MNARLSGAILIASPKGCFRQLSWNGLVPRMRNVVCSETLADVSLRSIENVLMKWALRSRLALFSAKEATSKVA
jgi:hypothetical protein